MGLQYVTGVQHLGLPTRDPGKTAAFYEQLGFVPVLHTRVPATQEEVFFLQLGGILLEVYGTDECAGRDGAIDHIALNVTDIQRTWEQVKALGMTPLEPSIQELPFWERGVRYFNIYGINHEKIEFCQIL